MPSSKHIVVLDVSGKFHAILEQGYRFAFELRTIVLPSSSWFRVNHRIPPVDYLNDCPQKPTQTQTGFSNTKRNFQLFEVLPSVYFIPFILGELSLSIEVGQLAPEFTLQDSEGKSVSLSDLRGQNVVVYFYPKDDTPGCTKESCGFRDLWGEFKNHNTVVIGISPDNEASHRKFVSKYDLPFTLLCDPDLKVMKQYGAYGEKTLYGRKMMGVIRSTVLIDAKGFIIKHWKRVSKAAEHPSKVLDALSIST